MNIQWYTWHRDQLTLQIHLQPGARKDECCSLFNNRLRIKITHGLTSRAKTVQIQSPKDLPEWFILLSSNAFPEKNR